MLCYWTALCERNSENEYSKEEENGLWESIEQRTAKKLNYENPK